MQRRLRDANRARTITLGSLTAIILATLVVNIYIILAPTLKIRDDDLLTRFIFADYITAILKILLDTYLMGTFIDLFLFFLARKKKNVTYLTRFNKFIVVWVLTLALLNYLHSLGTIFFNSYILNLKIIREVQALIILNELFSGLFISVTDFATALTFLYLFYFQGNQIINLRKKLSSPKKNRKKDKKKIEQQEGIVDEINKTTNNMTNIGNNKEEGDDSSGESRTDVDTIDL